MSRRLLPVALVAACVLLVSGCGGSDGGPSTVAGDPISVEELARSAGSSAEARTGRFAFELALAFPGAEEGLAFSGKGAFDAASKRASFAVDMSAFAELLGGFFTALGGVKRADAPDFDDPNAWRIEVVQDGPVSYVHLPAVSKQLPSGKTWIRSDGRSLKVDGLELGELEKVAGTDPRELLDVLRAAGGEVETVGIEVLRGAETTHYRVTIDPTEFATLTASGAGDELAPLAEQLAAQSGLGEIPVDVWLDGDGVVRKLALALAVTRPGTSESGSASMSFELWDYGENVEIAVPPASEVVEASSLD